MENEIWKDILGWEGRYQASNLGNIRSLCYNGGFRKTPKNLVLRMRKDGYTDVNLGCNCKKIVHILVWEAFNGPIPEGYEINHVNCIRHDNRIENLSLLTHYENTKWDHADWKRGKEILQYTLDGRFLGKWHSQKEIERYLGFSQKSISSCCTGRTKTSNGFIWKFTD